MARSAPPAPCPPSKGRRAGSIVLSIAALAHHVHAPCDAQDKVLFVSVHRHRDGVFPGSGGVKDSGVGDGKNHTINLPVS